MTEGNPFKSISESVLGAVPLHVGAGLRSLLYGVCTAPHLFE